MSSVSVARGHPATASLLRSKTLSIREGCLRGERKPRSIKKLRVVCQAGPKSSNVPRPRPSRFHKNSFSPFETRVDSFCSGARLGPTAEIGAPGARERKFECSGKETPRLIPASQSKAQFIQEAHCQSAAVPEFKDVVRQPCCCVALSL